MRKMPSCGDVRFQPASEYPEYPIAKKACFVDPSHFRIDNAINPHMVGQKGDLNVVDHIRAVVEWEALVAAYQALGIETEIWQANPACPDMVFCANQSLPFVNSLGQASALLSYMHSEARHCEVSLVSDALVGMGTNVMSFEKERSEDYTFEGTGDALWVPGRRLLLGGYGFRTHSSVYSYVSQITASPVILFELLDPFFYHLDTALSVIDDRTVLACKKAFTLEGWQDINFLFERVIEVPLGEANSPGFACNAHSPDQRHVIIQKGNKKTERQLEALGYDVLAVDTSEFIKSGGSVFCMKLMTF